MVERIRILAKQVKVREEVSPQHNVKEVYSMIAIVENHRPGKSTIILERGEGRHKASVLAHARSRNGMRTSQLE